MVWGGDEQLAEPEDDGKSLLDDQCKQPTDDLLGQTNCEVGASRSYGGVTRVPKTSLTVVSISSSVYTKFGGRLDHALEHVQ